MLKSSKSKNVNTIVTEKSPDPNPKTTLVKVTKILARKDLGKADLEEAEKLVKSIPKGAKESATAQKLLEKKKASFVDPEKDGLELVRSRWEKGGFGAIAVWKVTIKNKSKKEIGDIKFRTSYFSETRNNVGKGGVDSLLGKDTIQKVIKPGQTRTLEVNDGFVHSEAETANFELVSWRILN